MCVFSAPVQLCGGLARSTGVMLVPLGWEDAGGRRGRRKEGAVSRKPHLELVIGTVHLLVVVNLEGLQELEVEGETAFHPDAVVALQVWRVGLGILQTGDVAGRLSVQPAAALS